jgi:probable HAF family extracellular repeat protein
VGNSDLPGDTTNHAFLWTERTGMRDLGTLSGDVLSAGLAVNDNAQVVGVSLDANFNLRAYLWENGQMTALDDLIPASSRLSLLLACSINSSGEIAGLAINKNTGELHAFLAKPKT